MSLLWLKCKAKQSTLLYISQPVPADMCSLKHFWARDTSLVCSVLLEEKKRREKCKLFFLSLRQRVTFFDISTESLVLQHLLPDALIESPMSNRKRNKCFIELELSDGGREEWRGREREGWAACHVGVCGCQFTSGGLFSTLSISTFLDVVWIISVPGLDSLINGYLIF